MIGSIEDFSDMLANQVTIRRRQTLDAWGKKTVDVGAATVVRCRVQEVDDVIKGDNGVERQIRARIYIGDATALVETDDLVVMPDGKLVEVATVKPVYDEEGLHHRVVSLTVPGLLSPR